MTSISTPVNGPLIGKPVDRIDGPRKVSGRAAYAYEHRIENALYGVILGAGIARGRIVRVDAVAAENMPGVRFVMTYRNAPVQAPFGGPNADNVFQRARPMLDSDTVSYFDQPVALVVAESFEAARAAVQVIDVDYAESDGAFSFETRRAEAYAPTVINAGLATDSVIGDPETAFAAAHVRFDKTYSLTFEHHAPMEPHAAIAYWTGEELTIITSTQTLANIQEALARTLRVPVRNVRVLSPFVGGGFGSKLIPHAETVLAALAARVLGLPIKVAQTRQQMFANAGHRPMMEQRLRLGVNQSGRLVSLAHDVLATTARIEEFGEQVAATNRALYAAPNRSTRHRLLSLDTHRGEWMRGPGEAPGLMATECAMDELSEELGLDPIEFRVLNEPEKDPERGVPFSTRALIPCMREGAERFGWNKRNTRPGSRREGRNLIGMGMAAAIRPNYIGPSTCRVRIDAGGEVAVELDMTDIGTGTYTILAQIAAEILGLPIEDISVALGDSRFPRTAGSAGSWGASSAGSALHSACEALKEKIVGAIRTTAASPFFGANADAPVFSGGSVTIGDRTHGLQELVGLVAPDGLDAEGKVERGKAFQDFSQNSFGAHFAEVSVDADTGEIRLRRMLGVFAAGRILNVKTARSQIIGGMIGGVGMALMEEGRLDPRYGNFVYGDLANYHVPVSADIPSIDAVFLEEYDDKANVLGSKGIGELGICGAGAAIANATYNATGQRIRSFPMTVEKVLASLPLFDNRKVAG